MQPFGAALGLNTPRGSRTWRIRHHSATRDGRKQPGRGAACLENAVIPQGHQGPLHDRCRPDRCANSVIAAEHIPIWAAQRHTLLTLIATPGLSTCRKAVLERELADVDTVLHRTTASPRKPE